MKQLLEYHEIKDKCWVATQKATQNHVTKFEDKKGWIGAKLEGRKNKQRLPPPPQMRLGDR